MMTTTAPTPGNFVLIPIVSNNCGDLCWILIRSHPYSAAWITDSNQGGIYLQQHHFDWLGSWERAPLFFLHSALLTWVVNSPGPCAPLYWTLFLQCLHSTCIVFPLSSFMSSKPSHALDPFFATTASRRYIINPTRCAMIYSLCFMHAFMLVQRNADIFSSSSLLEEITRENHKESWLFVCVNPSLPCHPHCWPLRFVTGHRRCISLAALPPPPTMLSFHSRGSQKSLLLMAFYLAFFSK